MQVNAHETWSFEGEKKVHVQSSPFQDNASKLKNQVLRAFFLVRGKSKEPDENFQIVFRAIRRLMKEEEKPKRQIGFSANDDD